MTRRTLLAASGGLWPALAAAPSIIDTHIHLFDPTRPSGIPWPPKDNATLYKPALPSRYRSIAVPLGIAGAIVVEASPLLEDNQWVLDRAAEDSIIIGVVGNLEPAHPAFAAQLDRFRANPLFRGIRCGDLWGRNLAADVARPAFLSGLKRLAAAGLVMDTANPSPELLDAVLRLTDRIPDLRVVVDHLPRFGAPYDLRSLAARPHVYAKVSGVPRGIEGRVPEDLASYRDRLDRIFDAFGPGRVLYGSDWPNSDTFAPYQVGFRIVHEYFAAKGPVIAERYFRGNALAVYRPPRRG